MRRRKYGNKKCVCDGITFDSIKEKDRYLKLKNLQEQGVIAGLELQVEFELIPKVTKRVTEKMKTKEKIVERFVQHPIKYRADFTYLHNGEYVVEDVKSSPKANAIDDEFKLKAKLFRWRFGYPIKLVFDPGADVGYDASAK